MTLLQVLDADGTVITSSAELGGVPAVVPPRARGRRIVDDHGLLDHGPWLTEPTRATIANRPVTVTVMVFTSLEEFSRSGELLRGLLVVSVPVLGGLVDLARSRAIVAAGRGDAGGYGEHHRQPARSSCRRVVVPLTDDEEARLAHTLNDMSDRLERAFAQQQRFVADASHELRTPIAEHPHGAGGRDYAPRPHRLDVGC